MHEFSCLYPLSSVPHHAGEGVIEHVCGALLPAGLKPDRDEVIIKWTGSYFLPPNIFWSLGFGFMPMVFWGFLRVIGVDGKTFFLPLALLVRKLAWQSGSKWNCWQAKPMFSLHPAHKRGKYQGCEIFLGEKASEQEQHEIKTELCLFWLKKMPQMLCNLMLKHILVPPFRLLALEEK